MNLGWVGYSLPSPRTEEIASNFAYSLIIGFGTNTKINKVQVGRHLTQESYRDIVSSIQKRDILTNTYRGFLKSDSIPVQSRYTVTLKRPPLVGWNPGIGFIELYSKRATLYYHKIEYLYRSYKEAYEDILHKYCANDDLSTDGNTPVSPRTRIFTPTNVILPPKSVIRDTVPDYVVTNIQTSSITNTSATVMYDTVVPSEKTLSIWLEYKTSSDASWTMIYGNAHPTSGNSQNIRVSSLVSGTTYMYRLGVQINDSDVRYFPSDAGETFTTTAMLSGTSVEVIGPTTATLTYSYDVGSTASDIKLKLAVGNVQDILSNITGSGVSQTFNITSGLTESMTYTPTLIVYEAGTSTERFQVVLNPFQTPASNPINTFTLGTVNPTSISFSYTVGALVTGQTLRVKYGSTYSDTFIPSTSSVSGLTPDTEYTFQLVVTTGSSGSYTDVYTSTNTIVQRTLVNPISFNTVTAPTTTSIQVPYTLILDASAPALTRHVGYGNSAAGTFTYPTDLSGVAGSSSYTPSITGLAQDTSYFVRVELRDSTGSVYASLVNSNAVTTPANPITAFNVSQGSTPTTLSVTFTAPISGSQVRQLRYGATTVDISTSTSPYTLTGLTPNTQYSLFLEILTAPTSGSVYASSATMTQTTAANSIASFASTLVRATEATYSLSTTSGSTNTLMVTPSVGVSQDTTTAGTLRLTGLSPEVTYTVTLTSVVGSVTSTSSVQITTKTPDVWKAIEDFTTRYNPNKDRISAVDLTPAVVSNLSTAVTNFTTYVTGGVFDPTQADGITDANRSTVTDTYSTALTELDNVLVKVIPFRNALIAFHATYSASTITGLPQTVVLSEAITGLSTYYPSGTLANALVTTNALNDAVTKPDYGTALADYNFLVNTVTPFKTAVTAFGNAYYTSQSKVTGTIDGTTYPNLQTAITRLGQSVSSAGGETVSLYSSAKVFTVYTSVFSTYPFLVNTTGFQTALLELQRFLLEKAYTAFRNAYNASTESVTNSSLIADSVKQPELTTAINNLGTYWSGTAFGIPTNTLDTTITTDTSTFESALTQMNGLIANITTDSTGSAATLSAAVSNFFSAYDDYNGKGIVGNLSLTNYTIASESGSVSVTASTTKSIFYTGASVDRTKILLYAGAYDEGAAKTAFENALADLNTKANTYVDTQLQTSATTFRTTYAVNTLQGVVHSTYIQTFKDISGYTPTYYTSDLSSSLTLLTTYFGAGSTYTLPDDQVGSVNIGTKWSNRNTLNQATTDVSTFIGQMSTDVDLFKAAVLIFFDTYDGTTADQRTLGYMSADTRISGVLAKKSSYYDGNTLSDSKVYQWVSTTTNNMAVEKAAFEGAKTALNIAVTFSGTMVSLRNAYNTFWLTYGTGGIEGVSHVSLISQKSDDIDYPNTAIALLGTYGSTGTFTAPSNKPITSIVSTDTTTFTDGNASLTKVGGLLERMRTQAGNLSSAISTFVNRYTPLAQDAKDGIAYTTDISGALAKLSTYYTTTTISMTAIYTTVAAANTTDTTGDTTLFTNAKTDLDSALVNFVATLSNKYSDFRTTYTASTGGVTNSTLITDSTKTSVLTDAVALLGPTIYGNAEAIGTPTPPRDETQRIADIHTFTQGLTDLGALVGSVGTAAGELEIAVRAFFGRYMPLSADIKTGIQTINYTGRNWSNVSTTTAKQGTYYSGDTDGTYKIDPNPVYEFAATGNEVVEKGLFEEALTELEKAVTAYVNSDLQAKYDAFRTLYLANTGDSSNVSLVDDQQNDSLYPSAAIALLETYRTSIGDYTFRLPVAPNERTETQKTADAITFDTGRSNMSSLISKVVSQRTTDLSGAVVAFFTQYDGFPSTVQSGLSTTNSITSALALRKSFYDSTGMFSASLLNTYVATEDERTAMTTFQSALSDLNTAARTYIESEFSIAYSNFRGMYDALQNGIANSILITDSLPVSGTDLPNLRTVRSTLLSTYGNGAVANVPTSRSDTDIWADKAIFVTAKTELEGLVGTTGTLIQAATELSGAVINFFERYDSVEIAGFRNSLMLTTDTSWAVSQRSTFYANDVFSPSNLYSFVSNSDEAQTKTRFQTALTELNVAIRNKYIVDVSGSVVAFAVKYLAGTTKQEIAGIPTSVNFTAAATVVDTRTLYADDALNNANFNTYVGTLTSDVDLQGAKTIFDDAKFYLDRLVDVVVPLRAAAVTFKSTYGSLVSANLPEDEAFTKAVGLITTYFGSGGTFSVTMTTNNTTFNADKLAFQNGEIYRNKMMSTEAAALRAAVVTFNGRYTVTNAARITGFVQSANLSGSIADLETYRKVDQTLFGSDFATYISTSATSVYTTKKDQFEAGLKDLNDLLVRKAITDFAQTYTTAAASALSTPTNLVPAGSTLANAIAQLSTYWSSSSSGVTQDYINYIGRSDTTSALLTGLETQFLTGLANLNTYLRSAALQRSILAFLSAYSQTNRDAYANLSETQKNSISASVSDLGTSYTNGAFTADFFIYVNLDTTTDAVLATKKVQFDNDVLRINTMLAMATFKRLYVAHAANGLTVADKATADSNNSAVNADVLTSPTSTLQSIYEGYAVSLAEALRITVRGTISAFRGLCSENTTLLTETLQGIYGANGASSLADYNSLGTSITAYSDITPTLESEYIMLVPRYMGTAEATGAYTDMFNHVLADRRTKARTAIEEFHNNTWVLLTTSYSAGQTAFNMSTGDVGYASINAANQDKVLLRGLNVNTDTALLNGKTAVELETVVTRFNDAKKALVLLLINKFSAIQTREITDTTMIVRSASDIQTDVVDAGKGGTDTTRVRNAYIGTPSGQGVQNYWSQLITANSEVNFATAKTTAFAAMLEFKGLYDEFVGLLRDVNGSTYSNTNYVALLTYLDVTKTPAETTAEFNGLAESQYVNDITSVYSHNGTAYTDLLAEAKDAMKARISNTSLLPSGKQSYVTRYSFFESIQPITGITVPERMNDNNPVADIASITDSINATELAVIRQEYYGEPTGYVGHIAALETLITETEREVKLQAAETAIKRFHQTYLLTQRYSVPTTDATVSSCISNSVQYLSVGTTYARLNPFTGLSNTDLTDVKTTFEAGLRLLVQATINHFLSTYIAVSDPLRVPLIDVDVRVTNKIQEGTTASDLSGVVGDTISAVEGIRDAYLANGTGFWVLLHGAVMTQVKTHMERFEAVLNKATTLGMTARTFTGRTESTAIINTLTISDFATKYNEYAQNSTGHTVLLLSDIQTAFTGTAGYETIYGSLYNAYDAFQKDVAVQTVRSDLSDVPTTSLPLPTTTDYTVTNLVGSSGFPTVLQQDYNRYVGSQGQSIGLHADLLLFTKTQLDTFVGSFNTLNTETLARVTSTSDYVTITTSDGDTISARIGQLVSARANAARIGINQLQMRVLNAIETFNTALFTNNITYNTLHDTDVSESANRIRTAVSDVTADTNALTIEDAATDPTSLNNMKSKYVQASVDLLPYILDGLSAAYTNLNILYTTYAAFKSNVKVQAVLNTLVDISGSSPSTAAQDTIHSLRTTTTETFGNTTVSALNTLRTVLEANEAPTHVKDQLHAYIQAFKRVYDAKTDDYRDAYLTYDDDVAETASAATTPTVDRLIARIGAYTTYTANLEITNAKEAAIIPLSQFYTDLYTPYIPLLTGVNLVEKPLPQATPLPIGATRTLQSAVDNAPLFSARLPKGVSGEIEDSVELSAIQFYYVTATTTILPVIRNRAQDYLTAYIALCYAFDTFVSKEAGFYASLTAVPATLPSRTDTEELQNDLSSAALTYTISPPSPLATTFERVKDYPAHLSALYTHVKTQLSAYIDHFFTEYTKIPAPQTLLLRLFAYTAAVKDSDLANTTTVSAISHTDLGALLETYTSRREALELARLQDPLLAAIAVYTSLYDANAPTLLKVSQTTFNGLTRAQATSDDNKIRTGTTEDSKSTTWLSGKTAAYQGATTDLLAALKATLVTDISGFAALYTAYDGLDRSTFESDLAPSVASGLANVMPLPSGIQNGHEDLSEAQAISTTYNSNVQSTTSITALRDRYYGTSYEKGAIENLVVHVKANLARYIVDYKTRYDTLRTDTTEGGAALTTGQTTATQQGLVDDLGDAARLSALGTTDGLGAYTMSSVADMGLLLDIIDAYMNETPDLREAMRIHAHKKTTLARINLFEATRTTNFRTKIPALPAITGHTYNGVTRATEQATVDRNTVRDATTFIAVNAVYTAYATHMANLALDAMAVFNKFYADTASLENYFLDTDTSNSKTYNAFNSTYSTDAAAVVTHTLSRNAEIVDEYVGYSLFIESKRVGAQQLFQTVDQLKQSTLALITTLSNERAIANEVLPTSATGAPSTAVGLAPSASEATVLSDVTKNANITTATNSINTATRTEQIVPIQTEYLSHINDVRLALRTEAIAQLDAFQSQLNEWEAYKGTWGNTDLTTAGTRIGAKSPAEDRRDAIAVQLNVMDADNLATQDNAATLRETITTYRSYIATMHAFMAPPDGTTFRALKTALESVLDQFAKDLSDAVERGMDVTGVTDTTVDDKARLTTVANILAVDTEYSHPQTGKTATLLATVRQSTQERMNMFKESYERDVSGSALSNKIAIDPKTGYDNLVKPVADLSGSAPRLYRFFTGSASTEDVLAVYTVYSSLLDSLPLEVKRAEVLLLLDTYLLARTSVHRDVLDPDKTNMLNGLPTQTEFENAVTSVDDYQLEQSLTTVKNIYTAALAELSNRLATHVGSTIIAYKSAYESAVAAALPPLFSSTNGSSLSSRYQMITTDQSALTNSSVNQLLATLETYISAINTLSTEVGTASAAKAFNTLKSVVSGIFDVYESDYTAAESIVGLDLSGVASSVTVESNRTDIDSPSISIETLNSMKLRYDNDTVILKARVKAKAVDVLQTFNIKFTEQRAVEMAFTSAMEADLADLPDILTKVNAGIESIAQIRDYISRYVAATTVILALLPDSVLIPQNRIDTEQVITGFQTRLANAVPYALTYSNELLSANPDADKTRIGTLIVNADITAIKLTYQRLISEVEGKVAAAAAVIAQQKEALIAEAGTAMTVFEREYTALDTEVMKEHPELTITYEHRQQDRTLLEGDRVHTSVATYISIVQRYNRGTDVLRNGRRAYETALLATKRQTALSALEAYSILFGDNVRLSHQFTLAVRQAYVDVTTKLDVVKRPTVTMTELDLIADTYLAFTTSLEEQIRGVQSANITEAVQVIRRFKILFGSLTASSRAALPTSMRVSTASVLRDLDILSDDTVRNEDIASIQQKYTEYMAVINKVAPPEQTAEATLKQQRDAVINSLRIFNTTLLKDGYKIRQLTPDILRRLGTIATDLTYVQQPDVTETELRGIQRDYENGLAGFKQLLEEASSRPLPAKAQDAAIQNVLTQFVNAYTTTDRSQLPLFDANYVKLLFENQDNVYVYRNTQDALDAFTRGIEILANAPKRTMIVSESSRDNPEFDQLAFIIGAYLREFPLRSLGRTIPTDRILLSELKRNSNKYLKMYEVRDPQQRNYSVLVEKLIDQYRESLRLLRSYPLK